MGHAERMATQWSSPKLGWPSEMRIRSVKAWILEIRDAGICWAVLKVGGGCAFELRRRPPGYFILQPPSDPRRAFPIRGRFQERSWSDRRPFPHRVLSLGKTMEGKRVGHIVNFLLHQRIDKPQPSEIEGLR